MNSSKHFALMAHADDSRAFMRNLTGFEVSRMAGMPWTPADQPCEVILNGDYIGLYFLTETIRFAKTRINLTNPDDVVSDWLTANPSATVDDYPSPKMITPALGWWNSTTPKTPIKCMWILGKEQM